jgi:hypothetical protein
MGRVSLATKAELVAATGDRYRAGIRAERTKILDAFVAVTGYHRKHAIRLLRPRIGGGAAVQQRIHRQYGTEVQEFTTLKPKTRKDYGRYRDMLKIQHGHRQIATMPREAVLKLRDEFQATRERPTISFRCCA